MIYRMIKIQDNYFFAESEGIMALIFAQSIELLIISEYTIIKAKKN